MFELWRRCLNLGHTTLHLAMGGTMVLRRSKKIKISKMCYFPVFDIENNNIFLYFICTHIFNAVPILGFCMIRYFDAMDFIAPEGVLAGFTRDKFEVLPPPSPLQP